MNAFAVVSVLVALVAASTALGLLWRARTGRVRQTEAAATATEAIRLPEIPETGRATLLQFSTEFCGPCVPTRRVLSSLADELDDVQHVDVDLTHQPDVASRFNILQTPTTLILDRSGVVRARIGGAPRAAEIRAELQRVLAA